MENVCLSVAATEEMPLLKELWLYFGDTYVRSSVVYSNLNLDKSDVALIKLVILGLCIGISLAGIAAVFNKRVLGNVVRKLLSAEAFDPSCAKRLDELELGDSLWAHWSVTKSTSVRRVVSCKEEDEYELSLAEAKEKYEKSGEKVKRSPKFKYTPYKIDVVRDSFYIPLKLKYMADVKFERKGNTWISAILVPIVMAIVCLVAIVALPHLLEFLNNLFV